MQDANGSKASFDDSYDQPDPRDYFTVLGELDYDIPQRAHPVFRELLRAQAVAVPTVLDLGCSYAPNAALLRCDVTLQDLYDRYTGAHAATLTPAELAATDRAFFAERRRPEAPRVLGLDIAGNALAYAREVGLLDGSWAEDLESREPSPGLAAELADVSLITATGSVGYITQKTFGRLLDRVSTTSPPWVASFVLRMFPYDDIAAVLADHGLVTEQLAGVTFEQRRFASSTERDAAITAVRDRGLDPAGKEAEGSYHADFFLSRPAEPAGRRPVADLLVGAGLAF